MKILDWVIIILLIASLTFLMWFYFDRTHNECINNPFVYGAKELKKSIGYEVEGFVWFKTPYYTEDRIYFNTTTSHS
jgi:hypothetical protein